MRAISEPFTINYNGKEALVTEREISEARVFYINFTGEKRILVITVTEDKRGKKFWTSLPQGRQLEAEEIGKLIAAHIRQLKPRSDVLL